MTTNHAIAALSVSVLLLGSVRAQETLERFRDVKQRQWGYKRPDGSVAIPPRYEGAGIFRGSHAPVKDADGFAIIDRTGRVVQRIATDSVSAPTAPIPPPAATCAWSPGPTPSFSTGLQCYVRQLRGSMRVIGGDVAINPSRGEGFRAAVVLKFPTGVVVIEDIGYEGFIRRVLLPGITAEQAREWRLKLYPDLPAKEGCSETWTTGTIRGGAFIEQSGGC